MYVLQGRVGWRFQEAKVFHDFAGEDKRLPRDDDTCSCRPKNRRKLNLQPCACASSYCLGNRALRFIMSLEGGTKPDRFSWPALVTSSSDLASFPGRRGGD